MHTKIMERPRRNRKCQAIRDLVSEARLLPTDLVWPVFIEDGVNIISPIASMPGCNRTSVDVLLRELEEVRKSGIRAVALFPKISEKLKDSFGREGLNKNGLVPRAIKEIKNRFPDLVVISDIALDPFSSDGHDGVVKNGKILNDETLEILGAMALVHADAGVDLVAPSDMMDGRVGYIRSCLDGSGFSETGILSYTAKYASAFYGPFRDALDSAPKFGDKKTYQMDPGNRTEALRELKLDIEEGADIVMVKPAISYLDVIAELKKASLVPVAAYQVSGEYAMIKAAAEKGWIDEKRVVMESLTSIKRAGADLIFSYFAPSVARDLSQ